MKKLFLAAILLLSLSVNAQRVQSKFDYRFGAGTSLLGKGDMRTIMFENELNCFINNYLSTSISLGYGRSNLGVYETSSLVQGNVNIYLSPFKNTKKNDFRIGTGLSFINISDAYLQSTGSIDESFIYEDYMFDIRNLIGINIILEDTYSISEKFMLGLKIFSQPYLNGDINSGILLKIGFKI